MIVFHSLTDNELIALIKSNNTIAFNEIYKRHWKKLYREAIKRLNDAEQCEEVIQNVFIDLWIKRDVKNINNLLGYLMVATRYQICMLYKKHKQLPYFEQTMDQLIISPLNADSRCLEMELKNCITAWLGTQPEKRREIFRLRYLEDLTTREISVVLDISQKTVQNQLNTSLYNLRSSLIRVMHFNNGQYNY